MAGFGFLEQMFYDGFIGIVGDPMVLGILVFVFFLAFVIVQNTRLDHKIAIMIPATILAMVFAPVFMPLIALFIGGIAYLFYTKITNR